MSPALLCNCSIDAATLPPVGQNYLHDGKPTRYLFLLGQPYSGTSAVHFLLATSLAVSTLGPPGKMGPAKEGWLLSGVKNMLKFDQRWNRSFPGIPWQRLHNSYHSRWNLSRPILLENSPPEINHAAELNATFSPGGKVRFLLLVRSACSKGTMWSTYEQRFNVLGPKGISTGEIYSDIFNTSRSIVDAFGKDVFVLRFEDICLRWPETLGRLAAWEPQLGDIDISQVPFLDSPNKNLRSNDRGLLVNSHAQVSVSQYCLAARSKWQNHVMEAPGISRSCAVQKLTPPASGNLCDMAKSFGYQQIDTCLPSG